MLDINEGVETVILAFDSGTNLEPPLYVNHKYITKLIFALLVGSRDLPEVLGANFFFV